MLATKSFEKYIQPLTDPVFLENLDCLISQNWSRWKSNEAMELKELTKIFERALMI